MFLEKKAIFDLLTSYVGSEAQDLSQEFKDALDSYIGNYGHSIWMKDDKISLNIREDETGQQRSLLMVAAIHGHCKIMKLLINFYGANPGSNTHACGSTPLHGAAMGGSLEALTLLLDEYKQNPNTANINGTEPIHVAAAHGHEGIIRALVDKYGVSPITVATNKDSLAHFAAMKGQLSIVKLALETFEIPPVSRNDKGRTVLHAAARGGYENIVKYLISKHGVDPGIHDYDDFTPLHDAAEEGHVSLVRMLIRTYNTNPAEKANLNLTPLHCASANGCFDVLETLIFEFGQRDSKIKDGRTAEKLAQNKKCKKLLSESGKANAKPGQTANAGTSCDLKKLRRHFKDNEFGHDLAVETLASMITDIVGYSSHQEYTISEFFQIRDSPGKGMVSGHQIYDFVHSHAQLRHVPVNEVHRRFQFALMHSQGESTVNPLMGLLLDRK